MNYPMAAGGNRCRSGDGYAPDAIALRLAKHLLFDSINRI